MIVNCSFQAQGVPSTFTITKRWRQPKCPLTEEWRCHTFVQRNITQPSERMQWCCSQQHGQTQGSVLSSAGQNKKDNDYTTSLTRGIKRYKSGLAVKQNPRERGQSGEEERLGRDGGESWGSQMQAFTGRRDKQQGLLNSTGNSGSITYDKLKEKSIL